MATSAEVRQQYERWPYPHVPILGSVRRLDPWQLNADFLFDRCGLGRAPDRPRIWIAGCGTMQPYVFRTANPRASILATDLSETSLRLAWKRCAWHGARGVDFARVDLTDPDTLPDGPFDLIECYGVLMNLEDPGAALQRLAARLAPRGVLRIMVYPHYSRRRIFQIQRIATLCGLHHGDPRHPGLLRALVRRLPTAHPLRYAFDNYTDARNDAGLVDGFLHAGDRGFTGMELRDLCEEAGLRPAFWFHRPWARPEVIGPRLGLEGCDPFFVMHYLDLWQELRGNFVPCLVHADAPPPTSNARRLHPLLARPPASHPLARLGHLWRRLAGTVLRSRLDEPSALRISGDALRRASAGRALSESLEEAFRLRGVVLGEPRTTAAANDTRRVTITAPIRTGLEIGGINPFYQHLFDAWETGPVQSENTLGDLAAQSQIWTGEADPLESAERPFGLTPFGTYSRAPELVHRACAPDRPRRFAADWSEWSLAPDRRTELERLLSSVTGLPRRPDSASSAELWTLLCSHEQLTLSDS